MQSREFYSMYVKEVFNLDTHCFSLSYWKKNLNDELVACLIIFIKMIKIIKVETVPSQTICKWTKGNDSVTPSWITWKTVTH